MTTELLLAFGKSFLFVFATVLPILNPAATAPIFLGRTEGASRGARALLARRIARNMFALMVGSIAAAITVGVALSAARVSISLARMGAGVMHCWPSACCCFWPSATPSNY